mgnify:FL=1|jgi:hypothetical protein
MKVINAGKLPEMKITIDEKVYSDSLKELSVKELNKLLKQKQSHMRKKKKIFVSMWPLFETQISLIENTLENKNILKFS